MKFCPECGSILDGKEKCQCGYDTLTGKIDESVYKEFKNNERPLYEQSCGKMGMMTGMNQYDFVTGAKIMGINPSFSDDEILNQVNQKIFNKDNDNLQSEDIIEIMNKISQDKNGKNK